MKSFFTPSDALAGAATLLSSACSSMGTESYGSCGVCQVDRDGWCPGPADCTQRCGHCNGCMRCPLQSHETIALPAQLNVLPQHIIERILELGPPRLHLPGRPCCFHCSPLKWWCPTHKMFNPRAPSCTCYDGVTTICDFATLCKFCQGCLECPCIRRGPGCGCNPLAAGCEHVADVDEWDEVDGMEV